MTEPTLSGQTTGRGPISARWPSVLRGVAYGDAWGDPNEFRGYGQIVNRDHPRGIDPPGQLCITDDTQMTLHLARALGDPQAGCQDASARVLRARIIDEWARWYHDPDNNRAPGGTCMSACGAYARGRDWPSAMVARSTGCGTVMRTAPTAFLDDGVWLPMTGWVAASTHGHPAAILSAAVMAMVLRGAAAGLVEPGELTAYARIAVADTKSLGLSVEWVVRGHPWVESSDPRAIREFVDMGRRVLEPALAGASLAKAQLMADPWRDDPCRWTGQGWNAHTCLATALACADMFFDDPIEALRRAANTGGDSDSIGAVAGALIGAFHDDPWPREWFLRLEPRYAAWIDEADGYRFEADA